MLSRNAVRVIAGRWRGRKLSFPAQTLIRPTPDRLRETLFNWVMHQVPGSRCLDLFAGSGVLGVESLSRGASQVVSVEQDRRCTTHLSQIRTQWAIPTSQWEIVNQEVVSYLNTTKPDTAFNLVFLDPPYDAGLYRPCVEALLTGGWLAEQAWVYVETQVSDPVTFLAGLPYEIVKSARVGQAQGHLLQAIFTK